LAPVRHQAEAKGWADDKLKVTILEAIAYHMLGQIDEVVRLLDEALVTAEPGGFVRTFVDEGAPLEQLLYRAAARGMMPEYIGKLLAAFDAERQGSADESASPLPTSPSLQLLVEPLSPRELEVLHLVAHGLSNREIGERLFLALDTVKGHNRRIFGKLGVHRRTEAVARARELGLLSQKFP